MDTDLEGRSDSLFKGWRDLGKRPREAESERDDARDRDKLIVRNIDETKSMVREAREREYSVREKDVRGIRKKITNAGKDTKREQDKAWTARAAFAYADDEVCRLAYKI